MNTLGFWMKPLEQEVPRRFYLHGQREEQICRELNMSETSFRLLKSRAKTRLVEATQRVMRKGPTTALKRAIARTAQSVLVWTPRQAVPTLEIAQGFVGLVKEACPSGMIEHHWG